MSRYVATANKVLSMPFFFKSKTSIKKKFYRIRQREKKNPNLKKYIFFVCNNKRFKISKPISKHVFFFGYVVIN